MGTAEEHQREEIAALRGEVQGMREVIEGIPNLVAAAIKEALPATEKKGGEEPHTIEPAAS